MTITVTASGISLDGPLVAGEKVAVTVSGVTFAEDSKPTICLLGRFPDALLSSVELAPAEAAGYWYGELDTATKQTAVFFATARADECRDAVLELVAARQSVARLMVAFRNSALCPSPFHAPDASPVYIPVPGPPGQGGDPYDQNPAMDGEASAGVSDKYARGDHTHPTDTSRASAADVAAIQNIIPSTATPSNKLATAADIPAAQVNADWNAVSGVAQILNKPTIPAAQIQSDWDQTNSAAADYIKNKPTIPGPAPVTSVNGDTGDVAIYGNSILMSSSDQTLVSTAIANAQSDATGALSQLASTANQTAIAEAYNPSATSAYAVGDYVTYQGGLYKCSTATSNPPGAWDASDWTAVAVTDEMPAPVDTSNFVQWANANKNAVTIGTRASGSTVGDASLVVGSNCQALVSYSFAHGLESKAWYNSYTFAQGELTESKGRASHSEGNNTHATGTNSHAEGQATYAAGQSAHAEGQGTSAPGFASHAQGRRAICAAGGTAETPTTPHSYAFAWQGDTSGGNANLYYSHGHGTFNVKPVPASGSTDPATGFWIGEKKLPEVIAQNTNYLPYASTTTLAPETAVYRATATLSGTTATMPTVTITGIPTAAAYFAFELEVAVDATATALDDTAWSGWTWMDGGELPTADYAGKTLFIACRLDCTARTIVANCYDVR